MAKNSITPNKFHDCHIFSLSSQGSIYSLCRLPNLNPYGRISLLAASLRKPVFLLEFNHGYKESLVPYSRELSFTYLPGNAEIVSITAFCKPGSNNTVIVVAYIKVGKTETGQCLNIFTVKESGSDFNADGLASSCSLEINFIPYHVTHCLCHNEVTIVLSGSDNRVHLFTEDSITHAAQEKIAIDEFPEFKIEFPSVVLWIEFHILREKSLRLTAIGCECGNFYLYIVDTKSNSVKTMANVNHGTPVTSSRFLDDSDTLNLLVTSSLLPATVYRNILEKFLNDPTILTGSDKHDVITCSIVCDVQMDQQPTILLGTYGQELLAYRLENLEWSLAWQRSFSHPILALDYCDVTGDGVRELVALTTRGVQILQHDLEEIVELFLQRVSLSDMPKSIINGSVLIYLRLSL
ncbi:KICSTOR complex protein kaptin isoform X1 [Daphnia magna]|uniref:KICSTOR complex protein kaptin isoform X1 n=1 Tax=Daphnia magna TaxID=35525 RepID=UPI001E1BCFEE|nr:KICSTOR complex protein kaptin isoform X1 [Daphnia magna]